MYSCIVLQKKSTEIYNWNTEYNTITVIVTVISSTVHRLQDDPHWKCERCSRARLRSDWRVAIIHAESSGTVHSVPARASGNAQSFVCLCVCVCVRACVCVFVCCSSSSSSSRNSSNNSINNRSNRGSSSRSLSQGPTAVLRITPDTPVLPSPKRAVIGLYRLGPWTSTGLPLFPSARFPRFLALCLQDNLIPL